LWSRGFRGPAFLGDQNPEIANVHLVVKTNPNGFLKEYSAHALNNSKAYFGQVRDADASGWSPAARAARTVYLAKACYCGLLKTRRDGKVSVTYGDGRPGNVRLDPARVHATAKAFWSATICYADFEWVAPLARKGDFVVADPPYAESNDRYTAAGFGPDDQRRLAAMCRILDERGVFFLQTNSDCPLIRELYRQYHLIAVPPRPSLRCDGTSRQPIGELVITNYVPPAGAMGDLAKAAQGDGKSEKGGAREVEMVRVG
jgi:DNA adenine methylase